MGASQLGSVLQTKYCLMEETEVDNGASTYESQPETNITLPSPLSEQREPIQQSRVVRLNEGK